MKRNLVLAIVALFAVAAFAQASVISPGIDLGSLTINLDGSLADGGDTRAVNTNYDDFNAPSAFVGIYQNGSHELADDLAMVNVGAGKLDTMGFSIANPGAVGSSSITGGAGAIRFYDGGGNFINGFTFNLPVLNLPSGSGSRISFAAGALASLNIVLPANIYVSTQWTSITWSGTGTIAMAGVEIRDPVVVGTSTDQLIDVTANSSFNFGGNPLANMGYFIKTEFTPEPASLGILALGTLGLIRRRKTR